MPTTQRIIAGDCIAGMRTLPDESVHCCVTSPPYWGLRDYGHDEQIGLEATPEAYVARMVEVFREVRRVLRDDGTLWLNLGDSYAAARGGTSMPAETLAGGVSGRGDTVAKRGRESGYTPHRDPAAHGLKHKDLVGIPWRVAFALQADGWWLRQDIIWHKPNPMPESVRDRCTKAHEYVFLLTKSERYFYDADSVREPIKQGAAKGLLENRDLRMSEKEKERARIAREVWGSNQMSRPAHAMFQGYDEIKGANRRSVWTVATKPYSGAHFAVMPPDLVEPCIKAGCPDQCCSMCGAGYERITAKQKRFESGSGRSGNAIEGKQDLAASQTNSTPDIRMGPVVSVHTLGWAPDCDCAASGIVAGTVLDPFAGSGTTLAVAAELGRNAIGCELNPAYIELANQRIKESRAGVALFEGGAA